MKKLKIVFVDSDATYIRPLIERFGAELGVDKIDITIITEKESFERYFSELREVDILLINRDMYSERLSMHNIKNMFILSETDTVGSSDVYKYTSTKAIYDFVCANLKYVSDQSILGDKESAIISVYSPIGGSGKTTVALAFAHALSGAEKRVLFVSGEDIQSFDASVNATDFLGADFKKDVLNGVELSFADLARYIGTCSFDYILPVDKTLFSEGYSFQDFVRVTIMAKKLYDYIIFDMPSVLNAEICGFLQQSSYNIIVAEQGNVSAKKLDKLLSAIDYKSEKKYIFVCNKFDVTKDNCLTDEYMTNKFGLRITFDKYEGNELYKTLAQNSELKEYLKYII